MTLEEQIDELNKEVKCHLAPSPIHGIGVFALRGLQKGERLYCSPNPFRKWYSLPFNLLERLHPEVRGIILMRWPSVINGSMFQSPNDDVWLVSFMNHSRTPNYDVDTDTAIRDILKGEEITEDYRIMKNAEKLYDFL